MAGCLSHRKHHPVSRLMVIPIIYNVFQHVERPAVRRLQRKSCMLQRRPSSCRTVSCTVDAFSLTMRRSICIRHGIRSHHGCEQAKCSKSCKSAKLGAKVAGISRDMPSREMVPAVDPSASLTNNEGRFFSTKDGRLRAGCCGVVQPR